MPKEITHWAMAQAAADSLQNQRLASAIKDNIHLYYIGAVVPDTAYYVTFGSQSEFYEWAADRLHGTKGENTFEPVAELFGHIGQNPSGGSLAFALGALTHIASDTVFHPLVCHFAGDYHAAQKDERRMARARHRWIETLIDLWYMSRPLANGASLSRSLHNTGMDTRDFYRLAAAYVFNAEGKGKEAGFAFASHRVFQSSFSSGLARTALKAAGTLGIDTREHMPLFYPSLSGPARKPLAAAVAYKNPRTGEPCEDSLDTLEQKTIGRAHAYFEMVEQGITSGEGPAKIFTAAKGPSLETGVIGEYGAPPTVYNTSRKIEEILY
ncbi:MAG: zinc dependent phospholipase C family protein [Nitrospinae bacterium]|nr:zinc dependent phospholipase C family protein [Nitrospinota bacterium]